MHAFSDKLSGPAITLGSYNSIFADITNGSAGLTCTGTNNGFYSSATSFGTAPLTVYSSPFQSVGGGNYYLTDASGFRNYGTTTGPPASLLSNLKIRTTYPPIVVAGAIWNSSQALFPQAQRDTDLPDLGWHYAPLDYALGWVLATNCTVSVSNGTVIGTFATNTAAGGTYGLGIGQNAALLSFGAPNNPNWFVQYNLIQEQPITNWVQTTGGQITSEFQGLTPAPVINCRFTQFSMPAQPGPHVNAPTNSGPFNFTDCEFHGGKLLSSGPTINLTNCLLNRVYTDLEPKDSPTTTYLRNCLVYGGAFTFAPTNSIVQDNLFDKTAITNWNGYTGTNAYVTNYSRLLPNSAGDKILSASLNYQTGPLGSCYQPTNSPLINMGTTRADLVGLYHYTATIDEAREGTTQVDIGYHYVVTSCGSIDTVWVDDALPSGASPYSDGGDSWTWVTANPTPFSALKASQSNIGTGEHQHYFQYATQTLTVNTGDTLFAYVYLDPANVPSEVMLQWNDGTWEHRAYWGSNNITGWGVDGTASRRYIGPLPATGQWVRLEVPASQVALEGRTLNGMAFSLYGGRATWDNAGKKGGYLCYDTDGDGIPDYLEDANGNGIVDSGETNPQSATDLGLKVLITRPKANSTVP